MAAPIPQTYSGSVTVTAPGYPAISIPLTLLAGSSAHLTATPPAILLDLAGQSQAASATIDLDSGDVPVDFVASVSAGASWLTVTPSAGVTPATIKVQANPSGLPEGTYVASVGISGGGTTLTVPVNFVVSTLTVAPTSLSFSYQAGTGSMPFPQTGLISPGSTNPTIAAVTNNGGSWLYAALSSYDSPPRFSVSVNPVGLAPGDYTGNVNVTAGSITRAVSVRLTVTLSPVLMTNPGAMVAVFPNNGGPAAFQTLSVYSSDTPHSELSFTATASAPWISINPKTGSTSAVVGLSVDPAGMASGIYTGTVAVTASGAADSPHMVPVVMSIAAQTVGRLTVQPETLSFEAPAGDQPPAAQSLSILAPSATQFSVSAASDAGWLSVSSATGTTPGSLSVSVNPVGLPPGAYSGSVTVSTAEETRQVLVSFTVTATGPDLVLNSTFLSFDHKPGEPVPAAQEIQVIGPAATAFHAEVPATSAGGSWLSVTPASATAPATLAISVNPVGLAPGSYSGTLSVASAGGNPQTVFVSLVVRDPGAISVTPSALSFSCAYGGQPPVTQKVLVTSNLAGAVRFSAFPSSSGWLAVTPGGDTPATLRVSVEPGALLPGSYRGTISLSTDAGVSSAQVVAVLLAITEPLPTVTGVVNAATGSAGPVSPGMMVGIAGRAFAPSVPLSAMADENGMIATSLGDVRVYFGGLPAVVLSTRADQVVAMVPYALAGRTQSYAQVEYRGLKSNAFPVSVTPASPGVFSNASAAGSMPPLNEDLTRNSSGNPADKGSAITFYATGAGEMSPTATDGHVNRALIGEAPAAASAPVLPVEVTIDGIQADLVSASPAPGLVAGILELRAKVPAAARSGQVPLILKVGTASSQSGMTVAVR